jgi:hypothetical protein
MMEIRNNHAALRQTESSNCGNTSCCLAQTGRYRVKRAYYLSILVLAAIFTSSLAYGAAQVSIAPSGNSSYVIMGSSMDGVAGMELNIRYDSVLLQGTPTVKQDSLVSGAMFAANTSIPGLIKVAIISNQAFSGSGAIATVTFTSKITVAPLPTLTAQMIDNKGAPLSASVGTFVPEVIATSGQTEQTGQAPQTSRTPHADQTGQTGITSTPTSIPGSVTFPAEHQPPGMQPTTEQTPPQPAPSEESAVSRSSEPAAPTGKIPVETRAEETPQYIVFKGVLDRVKAYSGSRNLQALAALFDKKVTQTIRQEPDPALSNGQNKVVVTVDIPARITVAPTFTVSGGTVVSSRQEKQVKGRWIVEVVPEADTVRTAVTISAGAEEFEYPLTVAPPVKAAFSFDENGWSRFVREVGTAEAPQHDFNKDGVRDYIDEYIFVANYLARKKAPVAQKPVTGKPKK